MPLTGSRNSMLLTRSRSMAQIPAGMRKRLPGSTVTRLLSPLATPPPPARPPATLRGIPAPPIRGNAHILLSPCSAPHGRPTRPLQARRDDRRPALVPSCSLASHLRRPRRRPRMPRVMRGSAEVLRGLRWCCRRRRSAELFRPRFIYLLLARRDAPRLSRARIRLNTLRLECSTGYPSDLHPRDRLGADHVHRHDQHPDVGDLQVRDRGIEA